MSTSSCKILLIGDHWKEAEASRSTRRGKPSPFVGKDGFFLRELLSHAGILPKASMYYPGSIGMEALWEDAEKSGVFITNVFQLKPGEESNDIKLLCGSRKTHDPVDLCLTRPALEPGFFLLKKHEGELARLEKEIEDLNPNLVIALGSVATWALLGTKAISKVRGAVSLFNEKKVLPTYHPASVLFGKREWTSIILSDFRKAKGEMESPVHVGRINRNISIPENLADIKSWWNTHGLSAEWLSVDIETEGRNWISEVGIAVSPTEAIWIPFLFRVPFGKLESLNKETGPARTILLEQLIEEYKHLAKYELASFWESVEEEAEIWIFLKEILSSGKKIVGQNFMFDIQYFLLRSPVPGGILPRRFSWDTMIAAHATFPGQEKSLAFLASIHTNERIWKGLRVTSGKSDDLAE